MLEIVASGGRNYNCGSRCWFEAVFGIRQPKQIARCAAWRFKSQKGKLNVSRFPHAPPNERAPTSHLPTPRPNLRHQYKVEKGRGLKNTHTKKDFSKKKRWGFSVRKYPSPTTQPPHF